MKTKLITLNAELELIKEEYSVIYDKLISDLDKIINKYFIEPFDAKCIRRWFREDFHPNRGVYINFEIGFYNVEENRIDFGSDIWFEYCTAEGQLKVNYGTCGSYSKADIYQVKRVKTLAHVWNHIEEIEAELNTYAGKVTPTVIEYTDKISDIEHEINKIEQEINRQEEEKIDRSIVVGVYMHYAPDCMLYGRQKHFFDTCKVTKVTPKFVTLTPNSGMEYKVRKVELIKHIKLDYILFGD